MSPTARTLEFLRKAGYIAGVVERTLPKCFIKVDLFGWCDIVAVPGPELAGAGLDAGIFPTVYVQTTSDSNHSGRKAKILRADTARIVLQAGNGIWLVSWKQAGDKGSRWSAAVEIMTIGQFPTVPIGTVEPEQAGE